MGIKRDLQELLEEKGRKADPELVKAYAMLCLADALEQIGVYAFSTDAVRGDYDRRSMFEVLASDLPQAINNVARAIRGEE